MLELRINSGGKLPNFGFVVFDDSEPVQKILNSRVRAHRALDGGGGEKITRNLNPDFYFS